MARQLRRQRIRRGAEFWQRAVRRWQQSGLSAAAFCRRAGLPASSLRYWHRKLRETETPGPDPSAGALVPVEVVSSSSSGLDPSVFEVLLPTGQILRVPAGFDVEALRALIAVLEDRRC